MRELRDTLEPVPTEEYRPPSVDALARSMADIDLPAPLLVTAAREAIAAGDVESARVRAEALAAALLQPVVNATGVLLHTNLGRAPYTWDAPASPSNLEFDIATGSRGDRQSAVGSLLARLCDTEAAMVVNNGAAAVTLAVATLAAGRQVAVSRGESVEIGGRFRIPDVVASCGATLIDVGTTNRTRLDDFRAAQAAPGADLACVLRVHPSNFRIDGFVERPSVAAVADLGTPVVVDIGSGLLDSTCPWMPGGPPAWLRDEPAARQAVAEGASLVTFSGDKLLAGPQAGIIAGRADLVDQCAAHPLARAVRPGSHILAGLQEVALSYLRGEAQSLPFWKMATTPTADLNRRARSIINAVNALDQRLEVRPSQATPGAGSGSAAFIPSVAVVAPGDIAEELRRATTPVIARVSAGHTWCDLRSVDPDDDVHLVKALAGADSWA